jgi:hypothetical protein
LLSADLGQASSDSENATAPLDGEQHVNSLWVRCLPEILRAKIAGRHSLQAILGNSAWLFTDKILRMGVGLVLGVWVARYLGPGRFGLLNYGIAFASLFGSLATFGVDGIVVPSPSCAAGKRLHFGL